MSSPRFVERQSLFEALELAYHSEEHLLMLGPPGTAKTMLAESFAGVVGASFFHRLLHQFTEPEELLGPIDIQAYKQGRYERLVDGFLPTAEVVFLDEVFKSSSAILNMLLDAMEYRRILISPTQQLRLPLRMLIGASNEYPADNAGLAAFADRFLFVVNVQYVSDDLFRDLLTGGGEQLSIRQPQTLIPQVSVSDEVLELMLSLRRELRSEGVIPSDRRWVKSMKVLRVSAALRGSQLVERQDMLALRFVLASQPEHQERVERLIYAVTFPELANIRDAVAELEKAYADAGSDASKLFKVASRCKTVHASIENLKQRVHSAELDRYAARVLEINRHIIKLIDLRS